MTNVGRDFIAGALTGSEAVLFDAANTYIGVGNSNAAFDTSQTDLQGASKIRKGMESGYPIRTGNQIELKAVFAGDEANFAWEEWGTFNAASAGTMLHREVEYNGTKQAGQTWIFEVTLAIEIGA